MHTSSSRLSKIHWYDEMSLAELVHYFRLSCSGRLNDGAVRRIRIGDRFPMVQNMGFESHMGGTYKLIVPRVLRGYENKRCIMKQSGYSTDERSNETYPLHSPHKVFRLDYLEG